MKELALGFVQTMEDFCVTVSVALTITGTIDEAKTLDCLTLSPLNCDTSLKPSAPNLLTNENLTFLLLENLTSLFTIDGCRKIRLT